MVRQYFVRLVLTSIFILSSNAQAAVSTAERNALLELYNNTAGDAWHNNTNWQGAAGTECGWYGISCDTDGNLIGLNLGANNLRGPLPDSLINLVNLSSSDLRFNAVYSNNQAVIDFLDASGPVGSLLDTQTLDAEGINFSNVTATGLTINWRPVSYTQAGGYRVYMAQQIDSNTGSMMTDFVQMAEVTGKDITTSNLTGLVTCRQYFFKVVSFTEPHTDNSTAVASDGLQVNVVGTIPGFDSSCLLVGSPASDTFVMTSGGNTVESTSVFISVGVAGNRLYDIVFPGNDIVVGSIDGSAGQDAIKIIATDSITVEQNSDISGDTISLSTQDVNVPTGSRISNNVNNSGVNLTTGSGEFSTITISSLNLTSVQDLAVLSAATFLTVQSFDIEPIQIFESGPGEYNIPVNTTIGEVIVSYTLNNTSGLSVSASQFSITKGNESGIFAIDPDTGDISLAKPLDVASNRRYELEISFYWGEIGPLTSVVIINITDSEEVAGGCTLRPGAPFDPAWVVMFMLAGFYQLRRQKAE